jgi:hypothetical protein
MIVSAAGAFGKDVIMAKGQMKSKKETKKPKKEATKTPYVAGSGAGKPVVTQQKPKGQKGD